MLRISKDKELPMNDYEDPWIIFSGEMAEEFFRRHRETMPENPHDIWDSNEVLFFCYAFGLGAARFNFKAKNRASFPQREARYIDFFRQMDWARDESRGLGVLFWKRFYEYSSLFDKGTDSFFQHSQDRYSNQPARPLFQTPANGIFFHTKTWLGLFLRG